MKRILSLTAAVILILSFLVSCGGETVAYEDIDFSKVAIDKISETDKEAITAEAKNLTEAAKSDDVDTIKAAIEAFQKKLYEVSSKMYSAAGGDAGAGTQNDDGSFNADFTEK